METILGAANELSRVPPGGPLLSLRSGDIHGQTSFPREGMKLLDVNLAL